MFNWFKRNKEEVSKEPLYTNKGINKIARIKNPWSAYVVIKRTKHHIGVYSTKLEAQKARWEFIESLK